MASVLAYIKKGLKLYLFLEGQGVYKPSSCHPKKNDKLKPMKLLFFFTVLIGYGILTRLYYKDKKYIMASIWMLISLCIIYLMIEIYIQEY